MPDFLSFLPFRSSNSGWGLESIKNSLPDLGFSSGSTSIFYDRRVWIGVAVGGVLFVLALKRHMNKRARPLGMTVQYSLNHAKLNLTPSASDEPPPNVAYTFIVDRSGSMKERLAAVQAAFTSVMGRAQDFVTRWIGGRFKAAVVSVNTSVTVDQEPTALDAKDASVSQGISARVRGLQADGGTDLKAGLEKGMEQAELMYKQDKKAKHTVVLLSDCEVDDLSWTGAFQVRLAKLGAKFFSIGICQTAEYKARMASLATSKDPRWQGQYVDAGDAKEIGRAINASYQSAVPAFRGAKVRTGNLRAGEWSLNGVPSVATPRGKNSACDIGELPEGTSSYYVNVHTQRQGKKNPNGVKFEVPYNDRGGRPGVKRFTFKVNPVIDPAIIHP